MFVDFKSHASTWQSTTVMSSPNRFLSPRLQRHGMSTWRIYIGTSLRHHTLSPNKRTARHYPLRRPKWLAKVPSHADPSVGQPCASPWKNCIAHQKATAGNSPSMPCHQYQARAMARVVQRLTQLHGNLRPEVESD
jgi:hypothetical protein